MIRGACGVFLRKLAPPHIYSRIFEPGRSLGHSPSGLADLPRPFVFRITHLDGTAVAPGDCFHLDLHSFELREPVVPYFEAALARWAETGMGPGSGRARLERVESLDLEGQVNAAGLCSISLEPSGPSIDRVLLRFVTATEFKTDGRVSENPNFGVLFARLRDRICTLRSLYGPGPVELDFRGMGERASAIRLVRSDVTWTRQSRTSSRTGQTHPLGGFTGEAEYEGFLREFMPWLHAARWVGVGRQTVWGKGEIHVVGETAGLATAQRK